MEGGWEEWLLVGGDKRESEQREPIPVDHRSIIVSNCRRTSFRCYEEPNVCKRLVRILFQRFVNIARSVSSEDPVTMLRDMYVSPCFHYILASSKKRRRYRSLIDNNLENLLCSIEERFENKIGSGVKIIIESHSLREIKSNITIILA